MRLKRLELQGFKSFLDRTILTFEPGVTGVVGPNGCGKSNIVDAIQWVMGEQSAKHLRGDTMTDVIFNGCETRPAASLAEVSLVLERDGVPLAPQFSAFDKADEISITRRVYRDGTGEYLINKSLCRLKDIHELFMDTGVGKRAYSIIEQGQIDRMINVKPEERRHIFEEVAGITKYKAKRKEAERKLEATRGNMTRLQDIVNELEKQIRSLKIQATRARKYKELKSELETVDLFLLGRNLFTHKKNIDELQVRRGSIENERSESDAKYAQVDATVTELEIKRIDEEKAYQDLTKRDHELSLAIQKLEGKKSLVEERKRFLLETTGELNSEQEEVRIALEELENRRAQETSALAEIREAYELLVAELSGSESDIRSSQEVRQRAEQRRNQLSSKKVQLSHRAVNLLNQKQNLEQKQAETEQQAQALNTRLSELIEAIEVQKARLVEVDERIEGVNLRGREAEEQVAHLASECQSISESLSELEEKLFSLRELFHSKKSRLESLQELQENLEGYSPTAKEILLKLSSDGSTSFSAIPLAEVLQPEAELEECLETLLAADMNTLLVPTTEEAEALARHINAKDLEKVRVLALSELASATEPGLASAPAGCLALSARVRVTPGYEKVAEHWLGKIFLCPTQEELFVLRKQYPALTFVTPDSRTVGSADRTLASGTMPTKTGVFARRREIEELTAQILVIEQDLQVVTSTREAQMARLQEQEALQTQEKEKLSSIHIERVETRKEKEAVQHELSRHDREYNSVLENSSRNGLQLDNLREQLLRNADEAATVTADEESVATELVEVEIEIGAAAEALEALVARINERKIERTRSEEKVTTLQFKVERTEGELQDKQNRLDEILSQMTRDERELERLNEEENSIQTEASEARAEQQQTQVKCSDVHEAFNRTCTELSELRLQKESLQKRREEVLREMQDIEIRLTQEQSQFEHLCGLSVERYQREPVALDETSQIVVAELPLFSQQVGVEWDSLSDRDRETLLQEHLKNMRDKVGRYGEVNLTAIQEFDEIQKRYDFLMAQKLDLEKSIQILEEAIIKIDETTKVKFEETFTTVNKKFQEIFPILFNGGKAELTLVYNEHGQENGVDIMAQPPGKRLQSITLLSGGEKALTAVSLVLGIFARKPSPFCLLDEVDAPLDDANVSRFNTVVRKMAEKTQFIVITHNKKTMEIAEALYGVTMERAGISKMTSVRLN